MGYPMTFQRFINRNGLWDGDYGVLPQTWTFRLSGNTNDADDLVKEIAQHRREIILNAKSSVMMMAGDLRRLERDAVDENSICGYIAKQTGVSENDVAAVLKEFIAW